MIAGGPRRPAGGGRARAAATMHNENCSHLKPPPLDLSQLPRRRAAHVASVTGHGDGDAIARRLRELGFVAGERVEVVAVGPFSSEPLLVQVGYTRFALRRSEAARVQLRDDAQAPA